MKMTDAVNSIPADTDNTMAGSMLADAVCGDFLQVYERDVKDSVFMMGCRSGGRSGL